MGEDLIEQEKEQLREMIRMINEAHEKTLKPFVDRLVQLESLKLQPFIISREDAVRAGLL